jgi:6-phosphogluconolactonase (cycloisomerase 2 family)
MQTREQRDKPRSQALLCERVIKDSAAGTQHKYSTRGVAMKIGQWARLLLVAAPLLAGCGHFWDASDSSDDGTTTTTLSSGYFYITDKATKQVISYYINEGTLTEVSAYTLSSSPLAIAVAPNNKFLYVSTANGIYLYTISGGTLTLYQSSAIADDPAVTMAVDSTNSWLVEASGSGYLYAIPITAATGYLNGSCSTCHATLTGTTVNQLTIAPNNQYVFVACGTNGTAAFNFDATNSSNPLGSTSYATVPVVNTSSSATLGAALSVAVDPSNRLVYIGETVAKSSSGGLRAFTLSSSGELYELSDSPYSSGGTGPYSILPESSGDYVYVANWEGTSTGNINGFSIADSDSTYTLTNLGNAVATGTKPMALAEDSNNNFVLAVSAGGTPYFSAYFFDTTTSGKLDLTIISSAFVGNGIAANH